MSLRELQSLHVQLTAKLIEFATAQGFDLTWGQTLRTEVEAAANVATGAGILNSLHTLKLAVDFSLFKDGAILLSTADYAPLGAYWCGLNPLARWGGNFKDEHGNPKPDSDHFSLTYGGVE